MHPAELTRRKSYLLPLPDGVGEVFSFTTIYDPPAGFEHQTPYIIALVRGESGLLQLAQLTDLADQLPFIGMKVEPVTRILHRDDPEGLITYGYKFRPSITASAVRE